MYTSVNFLVVNHYEKSDSSPQEGKEPTNHNEYYNFSRGKFSFYAVRKHHSKVTLNRYGNQREYGSDSSDPTWYTSRDELAKQIPCGTPWVIEHRRDNELNPEEDSNENVRNSKVKEHVVDGCFHRFVLEYN